MFQNLGNIIKGSFKKHVTEGGGWVQRCEDALSVGGQKGVN